MFLVRAIENLAVADLVSYKINSIAIFINSTVSSVFFTKFVVLVEHCRSYIHTFSKIKYTIETSFSTERLISFVLSYIVAPSEKVVFLRTVSSALASSSCIPQLLVAN